MARSDARLHAVDPVAPPAAAPTPPPALRAIPRAARDHDALLAELGALRKDDVDWRDGRCFSLVYHAGDAHSAFLKAAHNTFFSENGLNPLAFQSLKRMETDVVRMTATLLHGDDQVVGTMTSGGTESLLMAVKTARDLARKKRPWIRRPNLVMPVSAHVAFDKAGHYFGVRIKKAPLDKDMRVNVRALKKLVDRNTILVVCSAPQYPHGVVDPVAAVAGFAQGKGIPCHVDACVGGFILPFLERLGRAVPPWDFRVDGVTSISADLHKFGYAAKGASTILYKNIDLLKHQLFVETEFPGGVYLSPSMPGTRPGGTIAAAWAGLQALGEDGYLDLADKTLQATDALRAGIAAIPGLVLLGDTAPGAPATTPIVCYAADKHDAAVDIYVVADALEQQGWLIDRQHRPASIHLTVTANHLPIVDEYLRCLRLAVDEARAHPERKGKGNAAMYGVMAKVPLRGAVKSAVMQVATQMYGPAPSAGSGASSTSSSSVAGDGPLGKLLDRYGDKALRALDALEGIKDKAQDARAQVRSFFGRTP